MTTINGVGTNLSNQSGTGTFCGKTSSIFTTPTIGVSTATSLNLGTGPFKTYIESTSFTPVFTFATPGDLSVVYNIQSGYYNQIGAFVFLTIHLDCVITYTTSSGFAFVSIPVVGKTPNQRDICPMFLSSAITYSSGYTMYFANSSGATTTLSFGQTGPSKNVRLVAAVDLPSGTNFITTMSGLYAANTGT